LLGGEVAKRLLLAAQMGWAPKLDDRKLRLTASATAGEETVLRAIDHLVETARGVALARGKVQRPEVERQVVALFELMARARGGRVSPRTGVLELELEPGRLEVKLASAGSSVEIRAALELARPLGVDLRIGLESERSRLDRWRHPDVQLGDEAFDDRFQLRGGPEEDVRAIFGEPVRALLGELADRVTDLSVDSKRIKVDIDHPLSELDELTSLVETLSRLAKALSPRREHGAYR
jgi:hypothetical protein